MDQTLTAARVDLSPTTRVALVVGVAGGVALVAGGLADATQFFRSYLLAFVYVVGIASGSLALLMVYHLTGGSWGVTIRRLLEAATRTLPMLALLFVPLAFGLPHVFPWTDSALMEADHVLHQKTAYLNVPFFLARAAAIFVIWAGLALVLNRWSRQQDEAADPSAIEEKMRRLSGAGVLLWGLATTFAAFDWVMSLDPKWYSTIFGVLMMGGHGLSAMAFALTSLYLLSRRGPLAGVLRPAVLNDLGNLLLAFVMLWAYFSFSQLLIIWSGNLPEEIPWYLHRIEGGWQAVGTFLAVFHFAVPFVLLLSRRTKRRMATLGVVAIAILAVRLVDVVYLIVPEFSHGALRLSWMDAAAVVGLGGFWLAAFTWQVGRLPILPPKDPELAGALARPGH